MWTQLARIGGWAIGGKGAKSQAQEHYVDRVLDRLIDTTAVTSDVDRDSALTTIDQKTPHDASKIQTEFFCLPDTLLHQIYNENLTGEELRKNALANEIDIKITLLERQEQSLSRSQDSSRARIEAVAINLGLTDVKVANKKRKIHDEEKELTEKTEPKGEESREIGDDNLNPEIRELRQQQEELKKQRKLITKALVNRKTHAVKRYLAEWVNRTHPDQVTAALEGDEELKVRRMQREAIRVDPKSTLRERQRAWQRLTNREKTVVHHTAKKLFDAENNKKEPY